MTARSHSRHRRREKRKRAERTRLLSARGAVKHRDPRLTKEYTDDR